LDCVQRVVNYILILKQANRIGEWLQSTSGKWPTFVNTQLMMDVNKQQTHPYIKTKLKYFSFYVQSIQSTDDRSYIIVIQYVSKWDLKVHKIYAYFHIEHYAFLDSISVHHER